MRTAFTALAACAALSVDCHAQSSVQLYGLLDAGLLYKSGADAAGHKQMQMVGGGDHPSRWGLKGSEALGDGWSANFRLENGFRINNGAFINGGKPASYGSVLFDRGATVGLSKEGAGGVDFGRNWTPFWQSLIASDASGWSNFGSLDVVSYQQSTGLRGPDYYWANNSVKYSSPQVRGLRGSVLYSFGGTAGDFQNARLRSAALRYENGPVLLNAGYLDANDLTGRTDRTVARAYHLGAMVRFPAHSRVGVTWTDFRDPATGTHQIYAGLLGSWQASVSTVLTAAYLHLSNRAISDGDANLFKLGANYHLSKRTALYAALGYVQNESHATLGLQNTMPTARAGDSQIGVLAGIETTF